MKRVVLQESVLEDDLARVAWDEDWSVYGLIEADETNPRQMIYSTNARQTLIRFVNDAHIEMSYLEVSGNNIENIERVISSVRSYLPTLEKADIIRMLNDATLEGELIQAVYYLGLISHNYQEDSELLELFQKLAVYPNIRIRSATLTATGYSQRKDLVSLLKKVASDDDSERIRSEAEFFLKGFETYLLTEN
jgi:HEAT repeats